MRNIIIDFLLPILGLAELWRTVKFGVTQYLLTLLSHSTILILTHHIKELTPRDVF